MVKDRKRRSFQTGKKGSALFMVLFARSKKVSFKKWLCVMSVFFKRCPGFKGSRVHVQAASKIDDPHVGSLNPKGYFLERIRLFMARASS